MYWRVQWFYLAVIDFTVIFRRETVPRYKRISENGRQNPCASGVSRKLHALSLAGAAEMPQVGAAPETFAARENPATKLTVSFPWAILKMTTVMVNGVVF